MPGHRKGGVQILNALITQAIAETPGLCMAGSLDEGNQHLLFDTKNQKGIENPHDLGT